MSNEKITVALSVSFLDSSRKLTQAISGKIWDTIDKFRVNPRLIGLNLEKLSNGYMSIRVDQTYRVILSKIDEDSSYLFVWVDHHDDAYRWAETHKVDVHRGFINVYESYSRDLPETPEDGLFYAVRDQDC